MALPHIRNDHIGCGKSSWKYLYSLSSTGDNSNEGQFFRKFECLVVGRTSRLCEVVDIYS
jgi:hypothetical protein